MHLFLRVLIFGLVSKHIQSIHAKSQLHRDSVYKEQVSHLHMYCISTFPVLCLYLR